MTDMSSANMDPYVLGGIIDRTDNAKPAGKVPPDMGTCSWETPLIRIAGVEGPSPKKSLPMRRQEPAVTARDLSEASVVTSMHRRRQSVRDPKVPSGGSLRSLSPCCWTGYCYAQPEKRC